MHFIYTVHVSASGSIIKQWFIKEDSSVHLFLFHFQISGVEDVGKVGIC